MEGRKQFTFYRSYFEAIQDLGKNDKTAVLLAVCAYALDGTEPKLNGATSAVFKVIRPTLDAGRRKAEGGTARRNEKDRDKIPSSSGKDIDKITQSSGKDSGNKKEGEKEKEVEKEVEKEKELENECYTPYPLLPREAETCPSSAAQAPAPGILEGKAFTQFWEDYPKKLDRSNAWEAWKALNPDAETVNEIRAGLAAWKRSGEWLESGGRYIPSAAKWLTNRRWEYAPPPAKEEIPNGATGGLGAAELDAIRRLMSQPDESEG